MPGDGQCIIVRSTVITYHRALAEHILPGLGQRTTAFIIMEITTDVVIIGAGPYGLSIAAYLQSIHADYRIIGRTMHSWTAGMPSWMLLKSEGIYSSMATPDGAFTLSDYCKQNNLPYHDFQRPVHLSEFNQYSLAYAKRYVNCVEDKQLAHLEQVPGGFQLTMDDESQMYARQVVIAVGHNYFRHIPDALQHLGPDLVTHSAAYTEFSAFKGKSVLVIGGNSSAVDTASFLRQQGAEVTLIARQGKENYFPTVSPFRPLLARLRAPMSAVGRGWQDLLWSDVPWLAKHFRERLSLIVRRKLSGPVQAGFVPTEFAQVRKLFNHRLENAAAVDGRVVVTVLDEAGQRKTLTADHVIAATGFVPAVASLPFLDQKTIAALATESQCPALNRHFESSVPNLYFVGLLSVPSFGHLMRFVSGTEFTVRRIAASLRISRPALTAGPKRSQRGLAHQYET